MSACYHGILITVYSTCFGIAVLSQKTYLPGTQSRQIPTIKHKLYYNYPIFFLIVWTLKLKGVKVMVVIFFSQKILNPKKNSPNDIAYCSSSRGRRECQCKISIQPLNRHHQRKKFTHSALHGQLTQVLLPRVLHVFHHACASRRRQNHLLLVHCKRRIP